MELYLIRHGRAEERSEFARRHRNDSRRPLTDEGCRRLREGARGLKRLAPDLGVIITSPFTRARQSAELLRVEPDVQIHPLEALQPGGAFPAVIDAIVSRRERSLALVGHEPDLGRLAALLLTGASGDYLPLKKGGVHCLCFDGAPFVGGARLRWSMSSAQLRLIGRAP